jgi:tRNA pseudouridine32 synthase/23S rRNA pseudouridine746 synthase
MAVKDITPDEMLARVLHRDGLMLVLDKPAGLAVHRGPKGGASLEDYFDVLRFGLPRPPALAHRLDKDTSGCLVLGRHRKALAHLGLLFKHGKVGKTYWAVVEGGPQSDEGTIALPLGRLDATRGWWMKPDPKGLPSVTRWKVLGRGFSSDVGGETHRMEHGASAPSPRLRGEGRGEGALPQAQTRGEAPSPGLSPHSPSKTGVDALMPGRGEDCGQTQSPEVGKLTWLALTPLTGRTHQLRVHCAAMGWPIIGDNIYGTAPRFGGPALELHAREVVVPISKNKEPVRVGAPVPPHMQRWLAPCGWTLETQ